VVADAEFLFEVFVEVTAGVLFEIKQIAQSLLKFGMPLIIYWYDLQNEQDASKDD